jgi:hypothetical protein
VDHVREASELRACDIGEYQFAPNIRSRVRCCVPRPFQNNQARTSDRGLPVVSVRSAQSTGRSLFADHCPIWHASGWMALCLEAIVFILPAGDAMATSVTVGVLAAAAQRERWRDRQRQSSGENGGTQQRQPKLFHQRSPLIGSKTGPTSLQ